MITRYGIGKKQLNQHVTQREPSQRSTLEHWNTVMWSTATAPGVTQHKGQNTYLSSALFGDGVGAQSWMVLTSRAQSRKICLQATVVSIQIS